MKHDSYSDRYLKKVLKNARTIAVVGASTDKNRPSYGVMRYLIGEGYNVIPVNPDHAGKEILGQTVTASLADIDGPVDMLDIFRRPEAVPDVIREAIAHKERLGLKSIWMQLGIRDDKVAAEAEAAGLNVVMDRCPAIERPQLGF